MTENSKFEIRNPKCVLLHEQVSCPRGRKEEQEASHSYNKNAKPPPEYEKAISVHGLSWGVRKWGISFVSPVNRRVSWEAVVYENLFDYMVDWMRRSYMVG